MLFANNANTTLNGGITAIATSMVVTSATGFPSPTGSQYFYCTLADAATQTTIEIVKVTAVSGTTFTIVRGQDGTSGTAFASGAVVSLRLVSASLNDFPKLDEANTFTQAQTFSALTSTRIPYSTTGGLQTDSANLTFDGANLTVLGYGFFGGNTASTTGLRATNSSQTSQYLSMVMAGTTPGVTGWDNSGIIEAVAAGVGSGTRGLVLSAYSGPVIVQTNGRAEVARFFASGGVSIGNTTDPGAGNLSVSGTIKTNGYTVATLPTGVTGARAYVTNALAPTFGATVVGGGAVTIPVFYNGANWIVG